jgi:hypothetical protein
VVGLHIAVGVCLIALNLAAGLVGGIAWYRNRPSIPFWYLLRVTNHEPKEGLHYLYGILPLVVSFIAEGARADAAQREVGETDYENLPQADQESLALAIVRREMGIMAVSCWVIFFLALRAAGTSGL